MILTICLKKPWRFTKEAVSMAKAEPSYAQLLADEFNDCFANVHCKKNLCNFTANLLSAESP